VADQRDDPDSVLHFTRELIRLRKAEATQDLTRYRELHLDGGLWVYQAGHLRIAANLSGTSAKLPTQPGEVLFRTGDGTGTSLAPWEGLITRAD
jgi:glycosidase